MGYVPGPKETDTITQYSVFLTLVITSSSCLATLH